MSQLHIDQRMDFYQTCTLCVLYILVGPEPGAVYCASCLFQVHVWVELRCHQVNWEHLASDPAHLSPPCLVANISLKLGDPNLFDYIIIMTAMRHGTLSHCVGHVVGAT